MTSNVPATAPLEQAPGNEKCVVCDSEVPRSSATCPICHFKTAGIQCTNCKRRIPIGARYCNQCKEYLSGRRLVNIIATLLSVAGAFIVVFKALYLGALYLSDRESHTNFKVASANQNVIYLTVWNTGQKPAALIGGRLHFGDLPIDDIPLDLPEVDVSAAKNVIRSKEERATIALTVPPFLGLRNHGRLYAKDDVLKLLDQKRLTLFLDVEESSGESATRYDSFTANRIQAFIVGRMYK